jgi:hypothetical protein
MAFLATREPEFRLPEYRGQRLGDAGMWFADYWQRYMSETALPQCTYWVYYGVFMAIPQDAILHRFRAFYEMLNDTVEHHNAPKVGHYSERM